MSSIAEKFTLWVKRANVLRALGILAIFSLIYLIVFFPVSYFRHDDWIHLGNSLVQLPRDWGFAFRGTQFELGHEEIWFFRPLVRFGVYLSYRVFGLHYTGWLIAQLGFTLASLGMGALFLKRVTNSSTPALLFLALFVASFHLHFGSLIWIGEGIMNCPQTFFMMASLLFFAQSIDSPKLLYQGLAILAFILSLGFKESSVFLPALLFGYLAYQGKLRSHFRTLIPYAILGVIYLYIRIFYLKLNPDYAPQSPAQDFGIPFFYLLAALAIPLTAWAIEMILVGQHTSFLPRLRRFVVFLPFLLSLVLPYFGHDFFSPGWLFLPGFFFLLVLTLLSGDIAFPWPVVRNGFIALLIVGLIPVTYRIQKIGWWEWHKSNEQIESILAAANPQRVKEIVIQKCESASYPDSRLERVVGGGAHLYELWRFSHPNAAPVAISFVPCGRQIASEIAQPDTLVLLWKFPKFKVLSGKN